MTERRDFSLVNISTLVYRYPSQEDNDATCVSVYEK